MGSPLIRVLLLLTLGGVLTAYAFWIYLRVELSVPAGRWLAVARSVTLVLLLMLLFDPRIPVGEASKGGGRWVLLDVSASMTAIGDDGRSPSDSAVERAAELAAEGWTVVRFGDGNVTPTIPDGEVVFDGSLSELAPVLRAVAESGAREARVLSDLRFNDRVAIRSALEDLPLSVEFEDLSRATSNAGIAGIDVSDVPRPDERPVAEVEIFGGTPSESVAIEILEEGRVVARAETTAPAVGLRSTVRVELPTVEARGRARFTARVVDRDFDGFPGDDEGVTYANIGYRSGALVLISALPDWEPRYLLPVLGDVTGLPAAGYLRVGPDRYVTLGPAADRGTPVDSATVRRAAADAALLVLHGLGRDTDEWIRTIASRPGRRLILPVDSDGAALVGLSVEEPAPGEWYVSPDVPTSPIAGVLAGVELQGLPPLGGVLVPEARSSLAPLLIQLRGAGSPESAFSLLDRQEGRVAVALASEFWRWAMRDQGREPYRRIWSGISGWLLADEVAATTEPRPTKSVFARGERLSWQTLGDSASLRVRVESGDGVAVDTTLAGTPIASINPLPPGTYDYTTLTEGGDTLSSGRFDVAGNSLELLPAPEEPELPLRGAALGWSDGGGRPLRTSPWPYALLILLLCGEWIVRRRSGLR